MNKKNNTGISRINYKIRKLTAFSRVMPDFIIIGGQRCGTTSLYHYLIQHPCIIRARTKEVHFYDINFDRGINWYKSNFPTAIQKKLASLFRGKILTGEASPYYIFHPLVAERIYKSLPDVKLIFILRNPVDRAYSHYCQELRKGREHLSFEDAISAEAERLKGENESFLNNPSYNSKNHRYFSYLARGLYEQQLKKWFDLFPKQNLFFVLSEKFFADPQNQLNRVFNFLGLADYRLKKYKKFLASKNKPGEISDDTRKRLARYYLPYNKKLYELLGEDCNWDQGKSFER